MNEIEKRAHELAEANFQKGIALYSAKVEADPSFENVQRLAQEAEAYAAFLLSHEHRTLSEKISKKLKDPLRSRVLRHLSRLDP